MSDEIRGDKPEDEVEAHHHGLPVSYNANDEKADEAGSGGDEVEAHRHPHVHNANDEKTDEADSGDDEVEAHRHPVHNRPGVHN